MGGGVSLWDIGLRDSSPIVPFFFFFLFVIIFCSILPLCAVVKTHFLSFIVILLLYSSFHY